jgi:hypothetical protein
MGQEQQPSPLRHVHIDLQEVSVVLEAENGQRMTFNPRLLIQQLLSTIPVELAPAEEEKESTVTLAGRLKSVPKEGRPDGSGFPTAWARFAAHEEGSGQAHMYIATFHRKARDIALTLKPDSQIIVEGYPHPASQPDRMDTLSVVHLINYPGKPANAEHAG